MLIKSILYKMVLRHRTRKLKTVGDNVKIGKNCNLQGNVCCGSDISIGPGAYFVSTHSNIFIHDHVIFGPNVTIYTGDHPTDIIGKHISEITDQDKEPGKYDKDVIIEEGCWIGTRAIILKGVTIGRGSVIGAGAIVTKDVPPYSIYTGIPSVRIRARFSENEIEEHEKLLKKRGALGLSLEK